MKADLILRAQAGDTAARDEVLRVMEELHMPRILAGTTQGMNYQDQEEVREAGLRGVERAIAAFDPRRAPEKWPEAVLLRSLKNAMRNTERGIRRQDNLGNLTRVGVEALDTAPDGPTPLELMERVEEEDSESIWTGLAMDALLQLSEVEQQILYLSFWGDVPVADIAGLIGRTQTATQSIRYRAIAKLRKALNVDEDDVADDADSYQRAA